MKITESDYGYTFGSFTEVCEAVLHTQPHDYVLVAMHEATDINVNHGPHIDHAFVIGMYRATNESYNAEQFEYAEGNTVIREEFYTDYEEAKTRYCELLGSLMYWHGL